MRCIRTVRELRVREGTDLSVVALYTPADRNAPFVRHADCALPLPVRAGEAAAFLDREALIETILRSEADAVWPGWGFLSEDAAFADRVVAEGLAFLGPPGSVIRALGDKISAKQLAERVGVPVVPWINIAVANPDEAARHASTLGYPVVIKASAGGGGRGIRVALQPSELAAAIESAAAEARAAFGDSTLFLEQKITGGRHIEAQIVADQHGAVFSLGCRDCSVQRRHQKIVEIGPPSGLSRERRREIEQAAIRIAQSAGYVGVGTVEFLLRKHGFYFLEMNPRLQVEHGITEEITGTDLVEMQIRIARREHLTGIRKIAERGVAIEARLCAEDVEAGFIPAPGQILRFDVPTGPGIRVDTASAPATEVPAAFDSLIAKVIARGATFEESRARLIRALGELEIIIEGGTTNKSYLMSVLDSEAFRLGRVDTEWLDQWNRERSAPDDLGSDALIAAAILSYREAQDTARRNLFDDPTQLGVPQAPTCAGHEVELSYGGYDYHLQVLGIGPFRYRIRVDGVPVTAALIEERPGAARIEARRRSLRLLYDVTPAVIRVEVEGQAYRIGRRSCGHVVAAMPATVVAVQVKPGEPVEAHQPLGLLEAMKMEVAFTAPVRGIVREVKVRKGQSVARGDLLVAIEVLSDELGPASVRTRMKLEPDHDPLGPLLACGGAHREVPAVDLAAADRCPPELRRTAVEAAAEEIRCTLLGYDTDSRQAERLCAFLEAPLPPQLSRTFRTELAGIRRVIPAFADVEQLFQRTPLEDETGAPAPSNDSQLRLYLRRARSRGAGLPASFLGKLRQALSHHGVDSLSYGHPLERALLRMLATQAQRPSRHRLVLALIRRVAALGLCGVDLAEDGHLALALTTIAGLRDLVSDAVADAAVDAKYVIYDRPKIERRAERTTKQAERWLASARLCPTLPPRAVLRELADAPKAVFARIGTWLGDPDPRRDALGMAAHILRLYAPATPHTHTLLVAGETTVDRFDFPDGRTVIGMSVAASEMPRGVETLRNLAVAIRRNDGWMGVDGIELFLHSTQMPSPESLKPELEASLSRGLAASRFTLTVVAPGAPEAHLTFIRSPEGPRFASGLHSLHPETACRIDLQRLSGFELERLEGARDVFCFHGRSRESPADQRIFVLVDVRGCAPIDAEEDGIHIATFEYAFYEAVRTLRTILASRGLAERYQWNRIVFFIASPLTVDRTRAEELARLLEPATRDLGLEKIIVRFDVIAPGSTSHSTELVLWSSPERRVETLWRPPRRDPVATASEYERKVADARRHGLICPYEIVRMLTNVSVEPSSNGAPHPPGPGTFEEYDLAGNGLPLPVGPPAGRVVRRNQCGIVFGVISTPTEKVREGMKRVLILSDPTADMGALGPPECDRILAALDLAARLSLPVEWIPVSSGARIAMDSGTENLDATARVARRIIEFTDAGGVIHVVVYGVNVGAQSYFNALATMGMRCRGALILTNGGSMVLTGRAALQVSGGAGAEDEVGIGGFERIMGPNGEAQYYARSLAEAFPILHQLYGYTYVAPGERFPRCRRSSDPIDRDITKCPYPYSAAHGFSTVGDIFDDRLNPERKRPFAMRPLMEALVDQDGGSLERWRSMVGAEIAIVWDAHLGGMPICLIGIESQSLPRRDLSPADGPREWSGATLFPLSSKKVARALGAASGNRPVVILANLSGFDGSPESMRKLQLEYGAEIARAVVRFEGPLLFVVVCRYHGGAYVVFSRSLNESLRAFALQGSYASVIGGRAAATVIFRRKARARALLDPRLRSREGSLLREPSPENRRELDRSLEEVLVEKQEQLAAEFDAIHTVERALRVGSLEEIVPPAKIRPYLIGILRGAFEEAQTRSACGSGHR
jgi:acetyl/propionyl-CoA carboxylase alpha subunit/acetyl-CoA carboxylase carboxyltransferase component